MKLVLLAIIIMVGGTAYLLWRDQNNLPIPIPFTDAHANTSKLPDAPPAPLKPEHKVARPAKKEPASLSGDQVAAVQDQQQPSPVETPDSDAAKVVTPPPVIHWPFPQANQVALGAGENAVTERYGNPSAWAVSSNDGHVIETLIYTEERGISTTVIRFVDGRVSAAYSKASPLAPRGSLIRDFDQQD